MGIDFHTPQIFTGQIFTSHKFSQARDFHRPEIFTRQIFTRRFSHGRFSHGGEKTPENGAESAKSHKIAKSEKKPINSDKNQKARTWRAMVRA